MNAPLRTLWTQEQFFAWAGHQGSGGTDRIVKVREYAAVPSMRHYVVLEYLGAGVMVLSREDADQPWVATTLTADETLHLPAIGIEIPVSEFYEGVDFADVAEDGEALVT